VTPRRLEAFTDGVLAIAITLLVLELRVPEVEAGGSLWRALGREWPSYAAYVVSFATIGIMWINHHAIFDRVIAVDRGLLGWNLLLLGVVAALPFTTAVLAAYLDDGDQGRTAAAVYCLSYAAAGLGFNGIWWWLARRPALLAGGDPVVARVGLRRSVVGPVVYAGCAGLGLVAPWLALAGCAVLAAYFATYRPSVPSPSPTPSP
jgi:uncharacterized membrane protein